MLRTFGTAAIGLAVGLLALPVCAADYGKVGDPIQITVGYQPYYTEAWSGIVINGLKLWQKRMPAGSQVTFQPALAGGVVANEMLAGHEQIGYMGDMPALVATDRRDAADIRLVSVLGTSQQQCNIFLLRPDAPEAASAKDAVAWLGGKTVAAPQGSCTDRFARAVFAKSKIAPAQYANTTLDQLADGLKTGKLDGAVIWEPMASQLVAQGAARRVATGVDFNEGDAGFLAMRKDLMDARPDVARAWLEAELDAQQFLADPKNAGEVVRMAMEQTKDIAKPALWASLYGSGAVGSQMVAFPFVFSDDVQKLAEESHKFLFGIKRVPKAALQDGAIDDKLAREVLAARGVTAPVGAIAAQPASAFVN